MLFEFSPLQVVGIAHFEAERLGFKVMRNVQAKMMPRSARPLPDPAADSYKKADETVKRGRSCLICNSERGVGYFRVGSKPEMLYLSKCRRLNPQNRTDRRGHNFRKKPGPRNLSSCRIIHL
jgi:hypothetical protein